MPTCTRTPTRIQSHSYGARTLRESPPTCRPSVVSPQPPAEITSNVAAHLHTDQRTCPEGTAIVNLVGCRVPLTAGKSQQIDTEFAFVALELISTL